VRLVRRSADTAECIRGYSHVVDIWTIESTTNGTNKELRERSEEGGEIVARSTTQLISCMRDKERCLSIHSVSVEYSQGLQRTSALTRGTCAISTSTSAFINVIHHMTEVKENKFHFLFDHFGPNITAEYTVIVLE